MYGKDREAEVGLFKELFPGRGAAAEGETKVSPFAGFGDVPSGGSPVGPAKSSPQQAEQCSLCGAFIHGGTPPIVAGICGPCDRDARGEVGLSRAEAEQLSAIADAAEEDQRQADAKRRAELPKDLADALANVAEQLRQVLLANGLDFPHQAPTPWATIAQAERMLVRAAEMGVGR